MNREKLKGALVHFFREGTENDYLDALNNAIDEIYSLSKQEEKGEEKVRNYSEVCACPFGSNTTSKDTFSTCISCGKRARF